MLTPMILAALLMAQPEIERDPDNPSHYSVELEANVPTPFKGVLLSPELGITLGLRAFHCDDEIEAHVSKTSSIAKEKANTAAIICNIQIRTSSQSAFIRGKWAGMIEERNRTAPTIWEHPAFVIPMTVLGTVAILWLAKEILKIELVKP